jgi:hypothetical protein
VQIVDCEGRCGLFSSGPDEIDESGYVDRTLKMLWGVAVFMLQFGLASALTVPQFDWIKVKKS